MALCPLAPCADLSLINSYPPFMKLSIIVPAKDEEKRIGETLERLGSFITHPSRGFDRKEVEIIVVVNNTTDGTISVVKKFQKKYPFISYVNIPFYTGKGGAVALGFQLAKGDYVAFADADGSSSPREIFRVYRALVKNPDADGAIANRYMCTSKIYGELPRSRRVWSRFFNTVVRVMFSLKYKDTQCGLKVFKKDVAKSLSTRVSTVGWTFDLNLLLLSKYLNYTIIEVPTLWTYKTGSTVNVRKSMFNVARELIQLKVLEMKLLVGGMVERTFRTVPARDGSKLLLITGENIWENAQARKIIEKVSNDIDVHVFMPKVEHKSSYEKIGKVEFTRRGGDRTYKAWLVLYYNIFLKRFIRTILSWNATKSLKSFFMPEISLEVQGSTIVHRGKNYKLSYTNLKNIIKGELALETITSHKYHPWSGAKVRMHGK
jgi:glycosyltransferase involved in cell wall biosynthesis